MFARVSNASKIALSHLVFFLREHGVKMIDCQQETAHLASLGAKPIARADFIRWIAQATTQPMIEEWQPLRVLYQ
jgi:leucyl/phenylalanyl-tRNA--protein transferase